MATTSANEWTAFRQERDRKVGWVAKRIATAEEKSALEIRAAEEYKSTRASEAPGVNRALVKRTPILSP